MQFVAATELEWIILILNKISFKSIACKVAQLPLAPMLISKFIHLSWTDSPTHHITSQDTSSLRREQSASSPFCVRLSSARAAASVHHVMSVAKADNKMTHCFNLAVLLFTKYIYFNGHF